MQVLSSKSEHKVHKKIFLTGSTGVIGSRIAADLIRRQEEVILLIRADSDVDLRKKFSKVVEYYSLSPKLANVQLLRGDLTREKFGLATPEWERISSEVTHIIHTAADLKLDHPMDVALQRTLIPTQHVLEFAVAANKNGTFSKFDYFSTVGVGGRGLAQLKEERVKEEPQYHNSYEAAKGAAEKKVFEEMERGLPASIYRPSMVVGDSKDGSVWRYQVFYYIVSLLSGQKTRGFLPKFTMQRLDTIPVNTVSDVIVNLLDDKEAIGRVFHLTSAENSCLLSEIHSLIVGLSEEKGIRNHGIRQIPLGAIYFLTALFGFFSWGETRKRARAFPLYLTYLKNLAPIPNRETKEFLLARGMSIPVPSGYLERVLRRYMGIHEMGDRCKVNESS